jgi:Tol biopolymer transport system component
VRTTARSSVLVAAGMVMVIAVPSSAAQRPGVTTRVSVSSQGRQADGDSAGDPVISASGRYVAFSSYAANLASGDTNHGSDVFRRDLQTGRTELVSVGRDGKPALPCGGVPASGGRENISWSPSISASGRFVAFASCSPDVGHGAVAPNLFYGEVYVRDMNTGLTTLVSVTSKGLPAALGATSSLRSLSQDGRYVAFVSQSPDLGSGATSSTFQVYVRDLKNALTTVASVSSFGAVGNADSGGGVATRGDQRQAGYAAISATGRYVTFASAATNLVAGGQMPEADPGAAGIGLSERHVYVHDRISGATTIVDLGVDGRPARLPQPLLLGCLGPSWDPSISADGRFVAFASTGTNLVPNPGHVTAACTFDIYVRDLKTGRVARVDVTSSGGDSVSSSPAALPVSEMPEISADGRYVAFYAHTQLTTDSSGNDVYLYDLKTGATEVVSRPRSAAKSDAPSEGSDTVDGRRIVFESFATNMVDHDTNGKIDMFLRDRGPDHGVGGLAAAGRLSVDGSLGFASTGLVGVADPRSDVDSALTVQGANLVGASLAYRPQYGDLFVRLQLERVPTFALADPAVVYGLDLMLRGKRYEVRVAKTGLDASFGLFRLDDSSWTHVADLRGGYGTTGREVVAALPLTDIGAQHGADLIDVEAFTGLGSYYAGAADNLDQVVLAH